MKKVIIKKIIPIQNSKGKIIKFLDTSSKSYQGFGEVYFSYIKKNNIKAWKLNKNVTSNLIVPVGKVLIVIYDQNEKLILKRFVFAGTTVLIPPLFYYGFMGIEENNLIVNFLNKKYTSKNAHNYQLSKFNFNWKKYKK
tara:strand:- start:3936 stop:4352 length:417 start_codon:yes stop_codon:yes gene_type:complete